MEKFHDNKAASDDQILYTSGGKALKFNPKMKKEEVEVLFIIENQI